MPLESHCAAAPHTELLILSVRRLLAQEEEKPAETAAADAVADIAVDTGDSAAEAASAEATDPIEADAPEVDAAADLATDASVGSDSDRDEL